MTGEEWDTRWWVIFEDLVDQGVRDGSAFAIADRECVEQFDERPEDVAS